MSRLHIPEYTDFLSENTIQAALRHSEPAVGVPDLMIANGLQADFPDIETPQALQMVCDVYEIMAPKLQRILAQRVIDRRFIDEETKACVLRN